MIRTNIKTALQDDFEDDKRFHGTFLHGNMETDYGYDIFCFEKKHYFKTGETQLIVDKKQCTLFLWEDTWHNKNIPDHKFYRGFLIYTNDPSYEWCLEKLTNKEQVI